MNAPVFVRRARGAGLALATAVLLSVTPSMASAATVQVRGDVVAYDGSPGERNVALMVQRGAAVVFQAGTSMPATGPGCRASSEGPNAVACDLAGVRQVVMNMGDGDDSVIAYPLPVPLSVELGPGDDAIETDGTTAQPVAVFGGDGRESGLIRPSTAATTVDLGPDDDQLFFETSNGVVSGGAGNDKITAGVSGARMVGGDGDDNLIGGAGVDLLDGGPGDDDLLGADGADQLGGGAGDDRLEGGRGDDVLVAGAGEDDVDAGRGDDRIDTSDTFSEHSLQCGQGADQLKLDARDALALDCERADGGSTAVGTAGTVTLILNCPGGCSGNIRLIDQAGNELGATTFGGAAARAAAAGATSVQRVRLNRRGARVLRARRSVAATARISARDSSGRAHVVRARYRLKRRR